MCWQLLFRERYRNLSVFASCLCSPVASVARRESVTSAVNLVADLNPGLGEFSSDQQCVDVVAEIESGIFLQLRPVENSETVVAPPVVIISVVMDSSCNRLEFTELLEPCCKLAIRRSCG